MGKFLCSLGQTLVLPLDKLPHDTYNYFVAILEEGQTSKSNGCHYYDFHNATLSFYLPLQQAKDYQQSHNHCCWYKKKGIALLFNEKLLGCSDYRNIPKDFSFFHYNYKESLHVSQREKEILIRELNSIKEETEWGYDRYSCKIIAEKTKTFLTYCKRFYERQFQMRSEQCGNLMEKLEKVIDKHIKVTHSAIANKETIQSISASMQMSEAYLADYLLFLKGFTIDELLNVRQLALADKAVTETNVPLTTIAKDLGFNSVKHLEMLFQNVYGCKIKERRQTT